MPAALLAGGLEEYFCRDGRVAAQADELHRAMEIGFAVCEALGEVNGVAGLDQDVQPPARNTVALGLVVFGDLWHERHCGLIRFFKDEPCSRKLELSAAG
jgi:hypothetical protein